MHINYISWNYIIGPPRALMLLWNEDVEKPLSKSGSVACRASDVQLEFVMLDPHVRTYLEHDS